MIEPKQPQPRGSRDRLRCAVRYVVTLVIALLVCCATRSSNAAQPNEYTLKVAYLYNFTRYVTWPSDAWTDGEQDFVIGVLGENRFGQTLDKLARRKQAQKRRLVIKYFKTLADCKQCHMLFISDTTSAETRAALVRQTRNQPVLLVGESSSYCEQGATVNFVLMNDGTIKIEINIDAMNRREMQVNALLLKLATVVRDQ